MRKIKTSKFSINNLLLKQKKHGTIIGSLTPPPLTILGYTSNKFWCASPKFLFFYFRYIFEDEFYHWSWFPRGSRFPLKKQRSPFCMNDDGTEGFFRVMRKCVQIFLNVSWPSELLLGINVIWVNAIMATKYQELRMLIGRKKLKEEILKI